VILDLGSGTGIGALSLLKFSNARKIIFSDYTQEILALLNTNIDLQGLCYPKYETLLVDWTNPKTYENITDEYLNCIIATDVIYKGSPYDHLAKLLRHLCENKKRPIK
jgi:predicted nicotinamide N-methyase